MDSAGDGPRIGHLPWVTVARPNVGSRVSLEISWNCVRSLVIYPVREGYSHQQTWLSNAHYALV